MGGRPLKGSNSQSRRSLRRAPVVIVPCHTAATGRDVSHLPPANPRAARAQGVARSSRLVALLRAIASCVRRAGQACAGKERTGRGRGRVGSSAGRHVSALDAPTLASIRVVSDRRRASKQRCATCAMRCRAFRPRVYTSWSRRQRAAATSGRTPPRRHRLAVCERGSHSQVLSMGLLIATPRPNRQTASYRPRNLARVKPAPARSSRRDRQYLGASVLREGHI